MLTIPAGIPEPPANLAEPVVTKGIRSNNLPLRIGAASDGSNRFQGDIAHALVAGKVFSQAEIAALADPKLVKSRDGEPVAAPTAVEPASDFLETIGQQVLQ